MTFAEAAAGPPFDAVIIGGGINGAAVAREAARRRLYVALFEADDFGFGTTWRSTRLIHGGLRYLEHGEIGLVYESLRERARLLRERPHLVRPQPFVVPVLPWSRRPAWQLRIGLTLYDLLALRGGLPRHRRLGRAALEQDVPGLTPDAGDAFSFYDARAVAPERLALELALEAREFGAFVANHARVVDIHTTGGVVTGVTVEHGGKQYEFAAHSVVNAAGPWVDIVATVAGEEGPNIIGATRGTHIVLEPPGQVPRSAVLSTARSDGRVFFAVPQDGLLLVGTTDVRDDTNPACVRPTRDEVDYLLDEARELFPAAGFGPEHVRYAFAGLRPLIASSGPEAAITRRHAIVRHEARGGPAGLYSLAGGKLSTYRPLAAQLLETLKRDYEPPAKPVVRRQQAPGDTSKLPAAAVSHLSRYGPALARIDIDSGTLLCPHTGALESEVAHAVEHEMATTLSDVLMRRTGIAWGACRGLCCHERAAELMAPLLGWDDAARTKQIAAFERDVDHHLPSWDGMMGV